MQEKLFKERRYSLFLQHLQHGMDDRGLGYHRKMFHCSNLGLSAGLTESQVVSQLKEAFPKARPNEVEQSVKNAISTYQKFDLNELIPYNQNLSIKEIKVKSERLIDMQFEELSSISQINLPENKADDTTALLSNLFSDNEYIFVGDLYSDEVKTIAEWKKDKKLTSYPFFSINPLSGSLAISKQGNPKFKCSANVVEYRYCLAEMDSIPLEKQCSFWYSIASRKLLPIASIVYSGNKSLHVIIKVNCKQDFAKWEKLKEILFTNCLVKYGIDPACYDQIRTSRLANHKREDGKIQELIYLGNVL